MKNFTRLLLFIILAFLAGCSKDSEEPLVGNWTAVSFTTSLPVDENDDGTAHTDLYDEIECVSMEASFTERGNFSIVSTDQTYEVQIVNGEVKLIPTGCGSYTEKGRWTLNAASDLLSLEFVIDGNPETTVVDVPVELSTDRLLMKELLFSEDSVRITYSVEFVKD